MREEAWPSFFPRIAPDLRRSAQGYRAFWEISLSLRCLTRAGERFLRRECINAQEGTGRGGSARSISHEPFKRALQGAPRNRDFLPPILWLWPLSLHAFRLRPLTLLHLFARKNATPCEITFARRASSVRFSPPFGTVAPHFWAFFSRAKCQEGRGGWQGCLSTRAKKNPFGALPLHCVSKRG